MDLTAHIVPKSVNITKHFPIILAMPPMGTLMMVDHTPLIVLLRGCLTAHLRMISMLPMACLAQLPRVLARPFRTPLPPPLRLHHTPPVLLARAPPVFLFKLPLRVLLRARLSWHSSLREPAPPLLDSPLPTPITPPHGSMTPPSDPSSLKCNHSIVTYSSAPLCRSPHSL